MRYRSSLSARIKTMLGGSESPAHSLDSEYSNCSRRCIRSTRPSSFFKSHCAFTNHRLHSQTPSHLYLSPVVLAIQFLSPLPRTVPALNSDDLFTFSLAVCMYPFHLYLYPHISCTLDVAYRRMCIARGPPSSVLSQQTDFKERP